MNQSKCKRSTPKGEDWQQWASSMVVGLTLLVILMFLFQQLSNMG